MSQTWHSHDEPPHPDLELRDWLRVLRRGVPLGIVVFGGLIILLLIRIVERPLCGLRRPVTPFVTQSVCRAAFLILGMGWSARGRALRGPGAIVANHSSWLDIFALNAGRRVYFVSKSEVALWPGIGWLARATGTLFIRRDPRDAHVQVLAFRDRLMAGHRLLFFPEGTSTDGRRVLPFKTTLFAAFLDPLLKETLHIQPVTLIYTAPPDTDPRFYGWWGSMDFGPHLLTALAAPRQGSVTVLYHPPLRAADFADRKALALATEKIVRNGLYDAGIPPP